MDSNRIIPPLSISLLTTFECTASCKNCCFGCNPTIKKKMTLREMMKYIDISIKAYSKSIKVLVLTGGEPFLLGQTLPKIIKYATNKGLSVRVVTNGYWARNYRTAFTKLQLLVETGLKEINFSTGDDHLEWVSYDNIVYGCMAAVELGITCVVNVESHDKAIFKAEQIKKDERLISYFEKSKKNNTIFAIGSSIWIKFNMDSDISYNTLLVNNENRFGCKSLFSTIVINPYAQLIACCGLSSERILPMRLGNVSTNDIASLYNIQFDDFLKIWLFIEGPLSILKFIYQKQKIPFGNITGHICDSCAEIFKDTENITTLKNHYQEMTSKILSRYSLKLKTLKKT
jgi:MoaA/NifB/PqqE/SkfB family radical SAM enzyme